MDEVSDRGIAGEVVRLYRDCSWSLDRVSLRLGVSKERIRSILDSAKVPIRPKGRPRISEKEWGKFRKIGAKSKTWVEYSKKAGIPPWGNPSFHRKHGVRLQCFFCARVSVRSVRVGPGMGSKPVCARHLKGKA